MNGREGRRQRDIHTKAVLATIWHKKQWKTGICSGYVYTGPQHGLQVSLRSKLTRDWCLPRPPPVPRKIKDFPMEAKLRRRTKREGYQHVIDVEFTVS